MLIMLQYIIYIVKYYVIFNIVVIFMHCKYRNDVLTVRTLLAAIDHNAYLQRKPLLSKDWKLKYNKVFSKRSSNWRVSVIKEGKTYDYWTTISEGSKE